MGSKQVSEKEIVINVLREWGVDQRMLKFVSENYPLVKELVNLQPEIFRAVSDPVYAVRKLGQLIHDRDSNSAPGTNSSKQVEPKQGIASEVHRNMEAVRGGASKPLGTTDFEGGVVKR